MWESTGEVRETRRKEVRNNWWGVGTMGVPGNKMTPNSTSAGSYMCPFPAAQRTSSDFFSLRSFPRFVSRRDRSLVSTASSKMQQVHGGDSSQIESLEYPSVRQHVCLRPPAASMPCLCHAIAMPMSSTQPGSDRDSRWLSSAIPHTHCHHLLPYTWQVSVHPIHAAVHVPMQSSLGNRIGKRHDRLL